MANSVLAKLAVFITANKAGLDKSLRESSSNLNKFKGKTKNDVNEINSAFNSLGAKLAAVFAFDRLTSFAKSVVKVTGEFQRLEAVLTNTLGSKGAAQSALKDIQDFAAKTPFSVIELSDSFVKLANQGFKPTVEELRKLGDLASSTGKGFNQLTEAIIDAQVGEFERLKEFGIRASKEGDKVTFTFKGVKEEVDFTAESIQKYILSLGDLKGVTGSMAGISETFVGKISNIGDAYDTLLQRLGNQSSGLIGATLDLAAAALKVVNISLSDPVGDQAISNVNQFRKGLEEAFKQFEKTKDPTQLNKLLAENVKETNTWKESSEELADALSSVEKFTKAGFKTGDIRRITNQQQVEAKTAQMLSDLTQEYLEKIKGVNDAKKESVKLTKEELKALYERSELERQARIAKLERSLAAPQKTPLQALGNFVNKPVSDVSDGANNAMSEAQKKLAADIAKTNNELTKQQKAWLDLGLVAAGSVAAAIADNESLGKSIANVAADLISASSKMISEYLAIGIARAFSINPIAGAAIAAAGLGVITGLLRKVGHNKSAGGTVDYVRPQFNRASVGMVQSSVVVTGVIRGQDIYLSNQNYQKASGYTKG